VSDMMFFLFMPRTGLLSIRHRAPESRIDPPGRPGGREV